MFKYALRYVPLLVLALFLIPLRIYMAAGGMQKAPEYLLNGSGSPSRIGSALYGVALLPSGEGWAVGGIFVGKLGVQANTFPAPGKGLMLHYTDRAWQMDPVSDALPLPLLSVAMHASQDGWAVGVNGELAHYDGARWSIVVGPVKFTLQGIALPTSSDGWAVGYSGTILHYDGKRWSQVQSPTTQDLYSVAMSSVKEGWAVGAAGTLLHYQGGAWSMASIDGTPTKSILRNVSMLSSDEGWAVGDNGTILHYRDGAWENVHPADYYRDASTYQSTTFYSIAMDSLRSGWIVGDQHLLSYSEDTWFDTKNINASYVLKKYAKVQPARIAIHSIAISSSGAVWAVGSMNDDTGSSESIALHYQNGLWQAELTAVTN